jgi:glycosyltransferase involved in cell wall biosynthesis
VTTKGKLTEPLWTESEAVAIVPVADASALVEAAKRLLADEQSRRQMSFASRAMYAERFDLKMIINALRGIALNV